MEEIKKNFSNIKDKQDEIDKFKQKIKDNVYNLQRIYEQFVIQEIYHTDNQLNPEYINVLLIVYRMIAFEQKDRVNIMQILELFPELLNDKKLASLLSMKSLDMLKTKVQQVNSNALNLSNSEISDKFVNIIVNLKNIDKNLIQIKQLYLDYTNISDIALRQISKDSQIQRFLVLLSLNGCHNTSGDGLKNLVSLEKIEKLYLL